MQTMKKIALIAFALLIACEGYISRESCAKECGGDNQIETYCTDCRIGGMNHISWCSCKKQ